MAALTKVAQEIPPNNEFKTIGIYEHVKTKHRWDSDVCF